MIITMKQVFILGASTVYGVGAQQAGWGDLVKQYFHSYMFSEGGPGEAFEVYNFAKSGATIDFITKTFPEHFENYSKSEKVISIASVGGNNSRANYDPGNFVSTPDSYKKELLDLVETLKARSDKIIFVGNGWVDETKTTPFLTKRGGKYYFTNERRRQFDEITRQVCEQDSIDYVSIDVSEKDWVDRYIYQDGLHPNQAGHQLIFDALKPYLQKVLGI